MNILDYENIYAEVWPVWANHKNLQRHVAQCRKWKQLPSGFFWQSGLSHQSCITHLKTKAHITKSIKMLHLWIILTLLRQGCKCNLPMSHFSVLWRFYPIVIFCSKIIQFAFQLQVMHLCFASVHVCCFIRLMMYMHVQIFFFYFSFPNLQYYDSYLIAFI